MRKTGLPVSTDGGGLDAWRRIISESFVPLDARQVEGDDFAGEVLQHSLGPVALTHLSARASLVRRTERLIRASSEDLILVTMHAAGTGQVEQDGRLAIQQTGDLVAYDTTRPYTLRFDDHRLMILAVPAGHLRRVLPMGENVARTIGGHEPSARVLRAFLMELMTVAPDLDDNERAQFGATALELLITAYSRSAPMPSSPGAALIRAQSFVADHLSDPDLTVDALAAAMGVSARHLSRLFSAQGSSPMQYVLDARLEDARRRIADPRYDNLTVAAIGHRVGILDPSVFGRAFRRKYGISPSVMRATRAAVSRDVVSAGTAGIHRAGASRNDDTDVR